MVSKPALAINHVKNVGVKIVNIEKIELKSNDNFIAIASKL